MCPFSPSIRVLQDPALDGALNMARDEALLHLVGAGESPPTLRLYQWDPATISLGYFQKYADYEALQPPARNLTVVRRQTGGGAILHDLELTYSITLPLNDSLLEKGPNYLYEAAHQAVIACLAELHQEASFSGYTDDSTPGRGPFFCFSRRHKYDVLLGADKLAGSAQRRTRQAVLQHGSIVLANRFDQQETARLEAPFESSIGWLRLRFVETLGKVIDRPIECGSWTAEELALGDSLVGKYAGDEWTRRA